MSKSTASRVYEGADVMDSREVIERIEELEAEREDLPEDERADWDDADDTGLELARLKALADDASRSADWSYGETLIADSYFEEYAQELAEDIGAIQRDASWPNNHIDWKAAAEALQQDYMSVEYGSTTYWIRAFRRRPRRSRRRFLKPS